MTKTNGNCDDKEIKGIIFDLDDTLYDYTGLNRGAVEALCQATCVKLGIDRVRFFEAFDFGRNKTKERLGDTAASHNRLFYIERMLEYLNKKPITGALELYEVYWQYILNRMQLFDGAMALFKKLEKEGIKIGICTDLTAMIQYRKLEKLDIDKYICSIVTSEEAGVEKPDKKIFELIQLKMQLNERELMFVGDSYQKDIVGALKAGFSAVWFNIHEERKEINCKQARTFLEIERIIFK